MKVLSIDFDYFQTVDANFVHNYPDGHDFSGVLGCMIWGSHYSHESTNPEHRVGINEKEMINLKNLLAANYPEHSMITQSHKDIYAFVHEHCSLDEPLEIVNIDMHHDMFNNNLDVDCGNWAWHLKREYNMTLRWVVNPISEEVYGMGKDFDDLLLHSVSELNGEDFDCVFLCRSDMWLPPHLDKYFDDLKNYIVEDLYYCNVMYNRELEFDRWKAVQDDVKSMQELQSQMLWKG